MMEYESRTGSCAVPLPKVKASLQTGVNYTTIHALSRVALNAAARRGDVVAGLLTDRERLESPHDDFERLRARGPVVYGRTSASIVDHEAINEVLRSDDFGVGDGVGPLPEPLKRLITWSRDPWAAGPVDPPSLLAIDAPLHTRLRRLVSRSFTARSISKWQETVEKTASGLVDELAEAGADGPVDLVDAYAAQLPVAIIAGMLGVWDRDQRAQVLEWGNVAATLLDPGLTWRQFREANRAVRDLHQWLAGQIEAKRREPGDDLLSQLVALQGEDSLTDDELRSTALLVLGAGFETTVNLISNAVALLDSHPEQKALALADPSRWGNVVEETLRFDPPVRLNVRQAYADTTVSGVGVPKGQFLVLFIAGANRDPALFDNPHTFDITRANADQHLSFSAGAHYCLGASLARLEARVALEALYSRFPSLEVAGTPERRGTMVLHGFEHLPVRLG
jgi:cytochrome P450